MQDDIASEAETGKIYRSEYKDKHGRTVLVMRPRCQVCSKSWLVNLVSAFMLGFYFPLNQLNQNCVCSFLNKLQEKKKAFLGVASKLIEVNKYWILRSMRNMFFF